MSSIKQCRVLILDKLCLLPSRKGLTQPLGDAFKCTLHEKSHLRISLSGDKDNEKISEEKVNFWHVL